MNDTAKGIAKGFFPWIFCWCGFIWDGAITQIYTNGSQSHAYAHAKIYSIKEMQNIILFVQ